MILMMKNIPVLETNKDESITIYNKKLIPFSLQKDDLTYEDFFFNWLAIIPFEEFAVWSANKDLEDEYEEAKKIDPKAYNEMQIADYILNNSDRHVGNWGFYFDINENRIGNK